MLKFIKRRIRNFFYKEKPNPVMTAAMLHTGKILCEIAPDVYQVERPLRICDPDNKEYL